MVGGGAAGGHTKYPPISHILPFGKHKHKKLATVTESSFPRQEFPHLFKGKGVDFT